MSEKRHKINKFANYQNIIVRNSPAFDHPVFVSSQDPFSSPEPLVSLPRDQETTGSEDENAQDRWSMDFHVMRMISTQIRWQDLILVPRARRFLVTWLQIKPSGSGDENGKTFADRFASCENIVWISFKRMYGK